MTDIKDNQAESRFELAEDNHVAIAAYRLEGERIFFTHTVVPQPLRGRGVGARLIAGALADAERRQLRVVALCGFVADYIGKHPETKHLLAED